MDILPLSRFPLSTGEEIELFDLAQVDRQLLIDSDLIYQSFDDFDVPHQHGNEGQASGSQHEERQCRICFCSDAGMEFPELEVDEGGKLISPCLCKGSMRWVHTDCLDQWRSTAASTTSEPLGIGFGFAMAANGGIIFTPWARTFGGRIRRKKSFYWTCRECGFEYKFKKGRWAALSSQRFLVLSTLIITLFLSFSAGLMLRYALSEASSPKSTKFNNMLRFLLISDLNQTPVSALDPVIMSPISIFSIYNPSQNVHTVIRRMIRFVLTSSPSEKCSKLLDKMGLLQFEPTFLTFALGFGFIASFGFISLFWGAGLMPIVGPFLNLLSALATSRGISEDSVWISVVILLVGATWELRKIYSTLGMLAEKLEKQEVLDLNQEEAAL